MTRVLFLVGEFPPAVTAGAFRPFKFARYLPDFGVEPIVVAPRDEDIRRDFRAPSDPSLLRELPGEVQVERVPLADGSHLYSSRIRKFVTIWFSIEENLGRRWRPGLERTLPEIAARCRPEVLYVSLPPFSNGHLAMTWADRLGLPLLVDMRDGWSHWCVGPYGTWLHYYLTLRRERSLFQKAAAVVTVTPQLANIFRRTHPGLPGDRIRVIPNGFDTTLDLPEEIVVAPRPEQPFRVGYLGSFYYDPRMREAMFTPWWRRRGHRMLQYTPVREDWLYRSPYFYFCALARLHEIRPDLRGRFTFELVGDVPEWLPKMAEEAGLSDLCRFHGRVPYTRAMEIQREFDFCLGTSMKVIGGLDYALASKTFDYAVAGKPILGFVCEGAQRDFLLGSGLGVVLDPDLVDDNADRLARLAEEGVRLKPAPEFLGRYHRRRSAESLSTIVKELASGAKSSDRIS